MLTVELSRGWIAITTASFEDFTAQGLLFVLLTGE